MKDDTPLAEVAQLLPREGAELLLKTNDDSIMLVGLEVVRSCYVYWEEMGIEFDPIQQEGVVNALIMACIHPAQTIRQLRRENVVLKAQVALLEVALRMAENKGGGQDSEGSS